MKTRRHFSLFTTTLAAALALCVVISCHKQPASAPPKEDTQTKETFRFGAILPLTGPGSALGNLIKRGLDLGLEDINSKTNAIRLEMILEDSKTNPGQALTSFRKLADVDKVNTVVVAFSVICNAVAPAAEESKLFMIGVSTSMPGLTENRKYVVRLFPTAEMFAGTIAAYAATNYSRVAVIYADDEYGKNTFLAFGKKFENDSRKIVFSEAFKPAATEFRETVAKMLAANPDAIYLPGYGPGYIALINQIREKDARIPILGDSPLSNPPVYRAAGNAVEGVIVPATPLDAGIVETPEQKRFLELYRQRFNENPSINVLINYDLIHMLASALQSTNRTAEGLRQAFVEKTPYHGITGEISFEPNGESRVPVSVMRIKGGTIVRD